MLTPQKQIGEWIRVAELIKARGMPKKMRKKNRREVSAIMASDIPPRRSHADRR